jgi:hypothetical protein
VHEAERKDYRFSALVLGVVKSDPFQMNQKLGTGPDGPARTKSSAQ